MILKLFKQKKNSYFVSYYYKKKKLYQIKLNYFEIFFFFCLNTSQLYGSMCVQCFMDDGETANSETVNSTRFARLPSNHSISNFHQMPQNVCPRVPECSTVVQATWSPSWKSPQVHILRSTCIATLKHTLAFCSTLSLSLSPPPPCVQLRINFPSKTKFKLVFFSLSNSRTEGKIKIFRLKEESVARICGMGRKGENVVTIIVIENGDKKDK